MTVNTLIFGPTGGVAGYALQYAASQGAHIHLAMRDTSKPISSLPSSQESSGNFTRIQADLINPASVKAAATQSKATSAFIYLIFGPNGTPRESIQALKDGGVKHVVFLSSYSIDGDSRSIDPSESIPYAHAQVEISLEDVFGVGNFSCVRPSWFASNTFRYLPQMKKGTVREMYPTNAVDFVAPNDIGEIVGCLLLRDAGGLPKVVELTGQQALPLGEGLQRIAKASGREIKVENVDVEEGVRITVEELHFPEGVARFLARQATEQHESGVDWCSGPRWEKGQKTVKELLGRDGITLDQWIGENVQAFA